MNADHSCGGVTGHDQQIAQILHHVSTVCTQLVPSFYQLRQSRRAAALSCE